MFIDMAGVTQLLKERELKGSLPTPKSVFSFSAKLGAHRES